MMGADTQRYLEHLCDTATAGCASDLSPSVRAAMVRGVGIEPFGFGATLRFSPAQIKAVMRELLPHHLLDIAAVRGEDGCNELRDDNEQRNSTVVRARAATRHCQWVGVSVAGTRVLRLPLTLGNPHRVSDANTAAFQEVIDEAQQCQRSCTPGCCVRPDEWDITRVANPADQIGTETRREQRWAKWYRGRNRRLAPEITYTGNST